VSTLDGGVTFDGRALTLSALSLRADEATLQIDGTVSVLVEQPSFDVRATGTADVERLARWAMAERQRPGGSIVFDVRAHGPFGEPVADIHATSARLTWQRINVTDVSLQSHVTAESAEIQTAQLAIAGGRVTAKAQVPFNPADAHVIAGWTGIDAASLVTTVAGAVGTTPTGTLSGNLEFTGPLAQVSRWSATVRMHAEGGATRTGRIAVPGDTSVQLANGRWSIQARHRVGSTVPLVLTAGGELNEAAIGQLDVKRTPRRRLDERAAGRAHAAHCRGDRSGGSAAFRRHRFGAVKLGGRLSAPTIDADVQALDLASMQFKIDRLRASAAGELATPKLSFQVDAPSAVVADEQLTDVRAAGELAGNALTISEFTASQTGNPGRVRLAGTYNLKTQQYDASADLTQWTVVATTERPLAVQLDGCSVVRVRSNSRTGQVRCARRSCPGMVRQSAISSPTLTLTVQPPTFGRARPI
jgi:autotransporter translocation and assembly factor TamB